MTTRRRAAVSAWAARSRRMPGEGNGQSSPYGVVTLEEEGLSEESLDYRYASFASTIILRLASSSASPSTSCSTTSREAW